MSAVPLAVEIHTQRADDFERDVASVLGAHRLRVDGPGRGQPFRLHHRPLARLSLSRLSHGRAVAVDVLAAREHWSVSMVTDGQVRVGSGARAQALQAGAWMVYAPDGDEALAYDERGSVQTLAVPIESLNQALAALLGHAPARRLRLGHGTVPSPAMQQRLQDLAARLWALDDAPTPAAARVRHLHEELALYELLLTLPHDHTAALQQPPPSAGSLAVRRALDYLQARVRPEHGDDVTLADVARHAGVGVRALGAAFLRETGRSPMRYLRQLRLDQARLDLLSGHRSVTEAATRWGFWNLGDFARHYQRRHGERPSDTARRSAHPVRFSGNGIA